MSDFIANFHFLRPLWLLAALPIALIFASMLAQYKRNTQWTSLIDKKLLPYLLDGQFSNTQKTPVYGLLALWLLATLALAGPTWQQKPQPVQKNISSMVILWDMSPSMYAQDIKPSRLVRSRLKLRDLLDQRKDGLTALIAYSGEAHVVTPLTDDTRTIKSLLPGINPSVMPAKGSNPENALDMAIELLNDTGVTKGDIVFATDGIAPDALNTLAGSIRQTSHQVSVWGIGTAQGAPIPLPSGGFAKNRRGEIVVAKVNDDELSDAAVSMGGVYIPFTTDNSDLKSLLHFGLKQTETENSSDGSPRVFDQWLEQGHWLVVLILPFAALAFRRGWIICLLPIFMFPQEGKALGWQDLWQTKDQQAQALLQQGDTEGAAQTFKDPDWKAIAEYKNGNFESASEQFSQGKDAKANYNYGNALTHQGKYDDAIAAFDKALELNPDFQNAKDNRAIAEQLKKLEEQQEQQQQNGDGENNEQQDGDQKDQQQSDSNQQDANNDQQQEGENNQQQQNDQQTQNDQQQDDQSQEGEQQNQQQEEQQNENINEQQKQALDQKYDQEQQEQEQQQAQQQEQNQQNPEQSEQQILAAEQMTDEEKEQQQALQQWLRKVPDDPSGLLRNKFKYEYQKRRREMQSRSRRAPNTEQERW
ncbi:VWA domain-containing protein [Agarilytica rhodophyticola]|uniref:VWA domain-containing protein n=1 Tax=Agarilytica rhodophyticola TaxID=1737490 RepID=UPI000B345A94|nr:VWA domain-containing protein [Agarilytica rhodophyticola]